MCGRTTAGDAGASPHRPGKREEGHGAHEGERGNVLIAPGRTDWIDTSSLYSTHKWASNTFIWSASEYQPSELVPLVWASAWTSPASSATRVNPAWLLSITHRYASLKKIASLRPEP